MTDKNDRALIVFARNLIPGKVKTRLAATIGNERALHIYTQLLNHTLTAASQADADLLIYYSDFIPDGNDTWALHSARRNTQKGNDLGACMHNALSETLLDYNRVVLIGSDCGELTTNVLNESFDALKNVQTVIGPAVDGGYYLVGVTQPFPGIFEKVNWSTEHVLDQTISRLIDAGLNFALGITLRDVDDEEDWEVLRFSEA